MNWLYLFFSSKIKQMKTITFIFLICCNLLIATAQSPITSDTTLPSTAEQLKKLAEMETGVYTNSVADFISSPAQADFKLSPNGDFLSYLEKDSLQNRFLVVQNIQTQETTIVLKEGEEEIQINSEIEARLIIEDIKNKYPKTYKELTKKEFPSPYQKNYLVYYKKFQDEQAKIQLESQK